MQNPNNRQETSQDFELITLLFNPIKPGFESFQARFQSFIDQIPSYLHSSNKPGFFPHFFLGSFAVLLDTELNKKLGIENLHFGFDGALLSKSVLVWRELEAMESNLL